MMKVNGQLHALSALTPFGAKDDRFPLENTLQKGLNYIIWLLCVMGLVFVVL
jgi:hypothetical protein